MSYRIEYDGTIGKYEVRENRPCKFPLILLMTFGLFFGSGFLFSPDQREAFRSALIPGEDSVTVQAFRIMTDDLRSGAGVTDALEAFCQYVIHER